MTLLLVQGIVAATVKASQEGAIPGKIDASLGHASFVFRAHRTFHNSLENMPFFIGVFFLAVMVGVQVTWVNVLVWLFFAARLLHMACYYLFATKRNPSLRSYFFLLGVIANVLLLVATAVVLA